MSQSLRPRIWASCIACLAFAALSAGVALAQQEEQQTSDQASSQSASQSQQQNDEQERQREQREQQQAEQERARQQQDRQRSEEEDQDEDRDQQERQRNQDRDRNQQVRERDEQNRQRDQQDRDRDQQNRQRDQQDRERNNQSGQRDQQNRQWSDQDRERSVQINRQDRSRIRTQDQRSRFPGPNRDGQFSRETQRRGQFGQQGGQFRQQYDIYSERQSRQFGSGDDEDAGLGVNIVSEGTQEGVTVVRVFPNTPAEQMGIEEGDRITQVNGQEVQSTQEFISQIRNMNPGDQVQLEVDRGQEEIIVSGQLETRDEALAGNQQGGSQSWQQEDGTWQTGYDEQQRDSSQQQGRIARGGDSDNRIQQLEQQVNRISQQLDQLRSSLRQLRQQDQGGRYSRSGERQAGYDEDQGRYQEQRFGTRQSGEQWDGQSGQRSGRIQGRIIDERGSRRFDGGQGTIQSEGLRTNSDWNEGGYQSDEGGSDSPGGVTGGLRTRPDNDPNWERR